MTGISIIMPLYNAAKYLEESLESIQHQSFINYELICINDASTDETTEILKRFQEKDNRIHVFFNEGRSGAAYSRNRGMSVANGKYLTFLDGDDIFDERMLEKAYCTIEQNLADVTIYEYQHVPSDFVHNKLKRFHGQKYKERYCKNTFSVKECEPYEFINWSLSPCNKLYRKGFIEEEKLFFQDLSCANDIYFVSMALMLAKKIIVLDDEAIMVYARDHSEIGRISSNRDSMCNYLALMKVGQELVRRGRFQQLYEYFYYRAYFSLKDGLMADQDKGRARFFYDFLRQEGIQNMCLLNEHCYRKTDPYIRRSFNQFIEKDYESRWYEEDNVLSLCLSIMVERVVELFVQLRSDNKKIAIWGAGKNGRVLLEFCQKHGVKIEAIIDQSENKQGNMLMGCMIVPPERILDSVQAVIISTRYIYEDVVKEVAGRTVEIIDINQFLALI